MKAASLDPKKWMSEFDDETAFADLNIPASHDSSARYSAFLPFSRCQGHDISRQLAMGCRCFDLRFGARKNKLRAVHGVAGCRTALFPFSSPLYSDEVFGVLYSFLDEYPSEAVIALVKNDSGSNEEFSSLFCSEVAAHADKWFTENRVPSLGEVRGRLVLVRRFACEKELGISFDFHGNLNPKLPAPALSSANVTGGTVNLTVQDSYRMLPSKKWSEAVFPLLNASPDGFVLNYLSTASPPLPSFNARRLNRKFLRHDLGKAKTGTVFFDFLSPALAQKVIESNQMNIC